MLAATVPQAFAATVRGQFGHYGDRPWGTGGRTRERPAHASLLWRRQAGHPARLLPSRPRRRHRSGIRSHRGAFFALIFAVFETALIFFAGHILETSVSDAARLIRTGQAQGMDEDAFRTTICTRIADLVLDLMPCEGRLMVDVQKHKSFDEIDPEKDLALPIDEDGNIVNGFGHDQTVGGDIVVVRVVYEWPSIVPAFGHSLGNLANGNRLLIHTETFRNEPFGGQSSGGPST